MLFGLRTGADVLGVLYLVSECILHLDREVFGILDWEVFGKSLHVFGILDWEVYYSEESSAARGESSSDGRKSETGSHNATISAYSSAGLHLDWIADKSSKLLNIIILQESVLHVRTMQAASQCGQCKQC